jgi:uncharacterized protein YndB with AHSA1/START domain
MIEVTEQISAVQRQVSTRVVEAGAARTLTISQSYDTTLEDLWDACTSPERIGRWFLPVSGDLKPGGRFQIEGNASGTVEHCDPPRAFATTWEFGGQVSWIEVTLSAEPDGRSLLRLEHIAHVDDEIWAQLGPGAVGIGWDMGFLGLAIHLSNGQAAERRRPADWMASPDGKRFVSLSSNQWRDASIAAGTSAADAEAAASRCATAYGG